MKKLFLIILSLFIFNSAYAAENLSFVYINGSNNNDKKMLNWYENGVNKLHPMMRKKFLNNKDIKKYYADKGGLNIKEKPVIFFWGFKSKKDLDFVRSQLKISKAISSTGAYIVQDLLTKFLHDAIWVQKGHNMIPILDELNEKVKLETEKGNKVVLYGYSAGTFITYEYMMQKLRYINVEELFKDLEADEDIIKYLQAHPCKNTCISALSHNNADIVSLSASGDVIVNRNKDMLKNNFLKLDDYTEKMCAPDNMVKGIVNFASPLILFYSDIADSNIELNYCSRFMVKYILENDIFMLTINFREDPLGFPTNRNVTFAELQDMTGIEINNPSGLIYDNSAVWSRRLFPFAHTSYWSANRTFSNAVTKTLVKGYKFNYDEKYQNKVLKRNSKKSEL
jgi:hypothetical protein